LVSSTFAHRVEEGGAGQYGWRGRERSGWKSGRRLGVFVGIGFLGFLAFLWFFGKGELFFRVRHFLGEFLVQQRGCLRPAAALYGGERGQGRRGV
jgi:hypothetical protein